jgi:hypothetical protein
MSNQILHPREFAVLLFSVGVSVVIVSYAGNSQGVPGL